MIIATHITNKAGYDAIRKAKVIRSRSRKRRHGESGWGFETDFLGGDARYVFLSIGEKYQYETMNEARYFFDFDAHRLISDFDALVGPDLANDYEQIVDAILKETNATLEPKAGFSDLSLDRFCAKMGMSDIQHDPIFRKHMIEDSRSNYQDLLSEFNDLSVYQTTKTVQHQARVTLSPHLVSGHIRRLPEGHQASEEATRSQRRIVLSALP